MKKLAYLFVFLFVFSLNSNAQDKSKYNDQNKTFEVLDVIEINGDINKNKLLQEFLREDNRIKNFNDRNNVLFYPGTSRRFDNLPISTPRTQIYGAHSTFVSSNVTNERSYKNLISNPESFIRTVPGNMVTSKKSLFFIEGYEFFSEKFKNLDNLKMKHVKTIVLVKNNSEKGVYIALMDDTKDLFIKKEFLESFGK